MYHGVVKEGEQLDCWWLLGEGVFRRQIEYVNDNFCVVSLDDVYRHISSNKTLPKNACVITFDDGYKNYLTTALPVLKKKGLPSTVYIPSHLCENQDTIWTDKLFTALYNSRRISLDLTDLGLGFWKMSPKLERMRTAHALVDLLKKRPVEVKSTQLDMILKRLEDQPEWQSYPGPNPFELLSVKEIEYLSKEPLVTIGSHSANHEVLTNLSEEKIEYEVRSSKRMLEEWIGRPVNHFSYPDGKYNGKVVGYVRQGGFKTAVRIGLTIVSRKRLFEVPRLAVGSWDSDHEFKSMVNGLVSVKVETRNFFRRLNGEIHQEC
ncbi:MAG: polysaccharide deacetylase family protein [Syntrophorhabdus aromaticivorans]|uniref:Polysaccharide deacetylase family protein n=1 Tax=Syntrophorhabdus aromaticivorans TaxID=328301 RepID=A0A971M626_9BACT|nr:polysaccharide deacetylase family protein [Syntrophorhabdus aromaticivorans]